MTDLKSASAFIWGGPLAVLALSLLLPGCNAQRSPVAGTAAAPSTAQADSNDPVAQAHRRGREWAMDNHANLVTDCGALADPDERFGCADYINTSRP
jgi:hypothetical protein